MPRLKSGLRSKRAHIEKSNLIRMFPFRKPFLKYDIFNSNRYNLSIHTKRHRTLYVYITNSILLSEVQINDDLRVKGGVSAIGSDSSDNTAKL